MSNNGFDYRNGRQLLVIVMTRSSTACDRLSPMFPPSGRWNTSTQRAPCLDYFQPNWTDIRPKSLCEKPPQVRHLTHKIRYRLMGEHSRWGRN